MEVTDHRYFIRTIIRHSDFVTKEASFDYMEKEGERMFLEALDQLEVAFSNPDVRMCVCYNSVLYLAAYYSHKELTVTTFSYILFHLLSWIQRRFVLHSPHIVEHCSRTDRGENVQLGNTVSVWDQTVEVKSD